MAQRVVVEMQMKTIKRYSAAGIFSCLFLLVLVALPIVELLLPFGSVYNFTSSSPVLTDIKMLDILKYSFNLHSNSLVDLFVYNGEIPSSMAQMYQIFITYVPYILLAAAIIFIAQCLSAVWAFVLVIIFIFRGRWSHFKAPRVFSHSAFGTSLLFMLASQGLLLFAVGTNVGKYCMTVPESYTSGAYLFFSFPGWLYSLIYFAAGFVGFAGIYFCYEYGLVDRIYIGKNRKKNEPDITFFDKGNYNVTNSSKETEPVKVSTTNDVPSNSEEQNPNTKDETKGDNVVGTTIKPTAPSLVPEPNKGLPAGLTSIGDHDFSENQCLIEANIPNEIEKIGDSAFSNCLNLKMVTLPKNLTYIGSNAFFNCARLSRINYNGSKAEWKNVRRGSNWLFKAGTKIIYCSDGPVQVNPIH